MPYAITDFSKAPIKYVTDTGQELCIQQRTAVRAYCNNNVGDVSKPGKPAKWKLRHIYLVSPSGPGGSILRKRVVIGEVANDFYDRTATPVPGVGTLDGLADWAVTGHFGEKAPAS